MTETRRTVLYADPPIVECHHGTFGGDGPLALYLKPDHVPLEDYAHPLMGGHRVVPSDAVESCAFIRADGPKAPGAVGETEILNGQAAMAASGADGQSRIAAGSGGQGVRQIEYASLVDVQTTGVA